MNKNHLDPDINFVKTGSLSPTQYGILANSKPKLVESQSTRTLDMDLSETCELSACLSTKKSSGKMIEFVKALVNSPVTDYASFFNDGAEVGCFEYKVLLRDKGNFLSRSVCDPDRSQYWVKLPVDIKNNDTALLDLCRCNRSEIYNRDYHRFITLPVEEAYSDKLSDYVMVYDTTLCNVFRPSTQLLFDGDRQYIVVSQNYASDEISSHKLMIISLTDLLEDIFLDFIHIPPSSNNDCFLVRDRFTEEFQVKKYKIKDYTKFPMRFKFPEAIALVALSAYFYHFPEYLVSEMSYRSRFITFSNMLITNWDHASAFHAHIIAHVCGQANFDAIPRCVCFYDKVAVYLAKPNVLKKYVYEAVWSDELKAQKQRLHYRSQGLLPNRPVSLLIGVSMLMLLKANFVDALEGIPKPKDGSFFMTIFAVFAMISMMVFNRETLDNMIGYYHAVSPPRIKRRVKRTRSDGDVEIGVNFEAHSGLEDPLAPLPIDDMTVFPSGSTGDVVGDLLTTMGHTGLKALQPFTILTLFMTGPKKGDKHYTAHTMALMTQILSSVHKEIYASIIDVFSNIGVIVKTTLTGHADVEMPVWYDDLSSVLRGVVVLSNDVIMDNVSRFLSLITMLPLFSHNVSKLRDGSLSWQVLYNDTRRKLVKNNLSLESLIDMSLYWVKFAVVYFNTGFNFSVARRICSNVTDDDYFKCIELNRAINSGTYNTIAASKFFPDLKDRMMDYELCLRFFLVINKKLESVTYSEPRQASIHMRRKVELMEWITDCSLRKASGSAKKQPYVVTLVGDAGIGKTTMMSGLQKLIHGWNGTYDIMNVKNIVDGDKFDSAFDNSTTGANWDDAGQILPHKRTETVASRLFRINATVASPYLKAEIECKGVCYNNLDVIVISTNDETLGLEHEIVSRDAGYRRLGTLVEMRVLPNHVDKVTGRLDQSSTDPTIATATVFPYWCQYRVYTLSTGKESLIMRQYFKNPECLKPGEDSQWMSSTSLIEVLYKDFMQHSDRQSKAMARETVKIVLCDCANGHTTTTCPKCGMKGHVGFDLETMEAVGRYVLDAGAVGIDYYHAWFVRLIYTALFRYIGVTRYIGDVLRSGFGLGASLVLDSAVSHFVHVWLSEKCPGLLRLAAFSLTWQYYCFVLSALTSLLVLYNSDLKITFWFCLVCYLLLFVLVELTNYIMYTVSRTNDVTALRDYYLRGYRVSDQTSHKIFCLLVGSGTSIIIFKILKSYWTKTLRAHDGRTGDQSGISDPLTLSEKKQALVDDANASRTIWSKVVRKDMVAPINTVGITELDLRSQIFSNLYRLRFKYEGGPVCLTSILFLTGNLVLTPSHIWLGEDGLFVDKLVCEYFGEGCKHYMELYLKSTFHVPGKDLAICYFAGPSRKNLVKFFCEQPFVGGSGVSMVRRLKDGQKDDMICFMAETGNSSYTVRNSNDKIVLSNCLKYYHTSGFQPGDCISPLIAKSEGCAIVGLHIAGSDKSGVATILTQGDIKTAEDWFMQTDYYVRRNSTTPVVFELGSKRIEQCDLHPNSAVNYMPDWSKPEIIACCPKTCTPRSRLEYNPYFSVAREILGLKLTFGKPSMSIPRACQPALSLISSESPVVPPDLRQVAVRDYLSCIPSGNVQPYTLHEALNGVPGNRYLFAVNADTSAGWPFNCAKKKILNGEVGSYCFDDDIHVEYVQMMARIGNGDMSGIPFQVFLKDEGRPLDKVDQTRLIYGGNAMVLVGMVQYLGPIVHHLIKHGAVSGTAIGLDPSGPVWNDRFYRMLESCSPNMGIETDFSKYDMSLPKELVESVATIFVLVAGRLGYDRAQLKVVTGLCSEFISPLVNMFGTILEPTKLWPSGSFVTAIGGSMCGTLLYMCSFYKHNPKLMELARNGEYSFRDHIFLQNLGDDNVGGILRDSEWNLEKFCKDISDWGMMATTPSANKVASTGFVKLQEVTFLKRKFRYDVKLGHMVGPLDPESIFKPLQVYAPATDRLTQIISTNQTIISEMLLHGEAVFDTFIVKFRAYVAEAQLPDFEMLHKDFDTLATEHRIKHAIVTNYDKPMFCRTDSVWEMPWELVAHSGVEEVGISTVVSPSVVEDYSLSFKDPTRVLNFESSITPVEALDREVLIKRYVIGLDTAFAEVVDPLRLLMQHPFINAHLKGYTKITTDIELRFAITGGSGLAGAMVASILPYPNANDSNNDMYSLGLDVTNCWATSRQHVKFEVGRETKNILKVPWLHYQPALRISDVTASSVGSLVDLPACHIHSIVPLWDAYGISSGATLSVFARLVNYQVSGAMQANSGEEVPKEKISSKISAVANFSRIAAASTSAYPAVALPFEVAADALDGISGVARLLGYSRPAQLSAMSVIPTLGCSLSVANLDIPMKKLTVDADRQTTVDGRLFSEEFDSLMISEFISRPVVIGQFKWDSAVAANTVLYTDAVTPFKSILSTASGVGQTFVLTPSALVATQFKYWRGSMHYRLTITSQTATSGILIMLYDSDGNIDTDITTTPNFQMDIGESRVFEWSIHWTSPSAMLFCEENPAGGGYFLSQSNNGLFTIAVHHTLNGIGSVVPRAHGTLECWADKDLLFMNHGISAPFDVDYYNNQNVAYDPDGLATKTFKDVRFGRHDRVHKKGSDHVCTTLGEYQLYSKDWKDPCSPTAHSYAPSVPPIHTYAPTRIRTTRRNATPVNSDLYSTVPVKLVSNSVVPTVKTTRQFSSVPKVDELSVAPTVLIRKTTLTPTMLATAKATLSPVTIKPTLATVFLKSFLPKSLAPTDAAHVVHTVKPATHVPVVTQVPTQKHTLPHTATPTNPSTQKGTSHHTNLVSVKPTLLHTVHHTLVKTNAPSTAEPTLMWAFPCPFTDPILKNWTGVTPMMNLDYCTVVPSGDSYDVCTTKPAVAGVVPQGLYFTFPVYVCNTTGKITLKMKNYDNSAFKELAAGKDTLNFDDSSQTVSLTLCGYSNGWQVYRSKIYYFYNPVEFTKMYMEMPSGIEWHWYSYLNALGGAVTTTVNANGTLFPCKNYYNYVNASGKLITQLGQIKGVIPSNASCGSGTWPAVMVANGSWYVDNTSWGQPVNSWIPTLTSVVLMIPTLTAGRDFQFHADNNAISNRRLMNFVGVWIPKVVNQSLVGHSGVEFEKEPPIPHFEVGIKGGEEWVKRIHCGEAVASIRQLLKIFRPNSTYVSKTMNTDTTFVSETWFADIYDFYGQLPFSPLNLFSRCFSVMRGSMISYFRIEGDAVMTVMKGNLSPLTGTTIPSEYSYYHGYEIADSRINPVLVAEFPYYSPARFAIPRCIAETGAHQPAVDNPWLQVGKRFSLDARTAAVVYEDTAISEDFMLSNFIGSPAFSRVIKPTPTLPPVP